MGKSKFRRILTIFISVCICLMLIPVRSLLADNTGSDADYQMDGGILTKYVGTATTVSIPAFVKEIGSNAFDGNSTVSNVVIGSTVKKIGNYAFHNCSSLKNVEISDSVTSIGNSAFADCISLTNVKIGSGVTQVGDCSFGGCTSLSSIGVSVNNTYLTCYKGALYGKNKEILLQVLAGRSGETYTMPDSVKQIAPYALWGCDKIKTLSFSGGITKISDYALYNATGLQFVDVPESVSSIDLRAFGYNHNLEEVILPLSVVTIHDSAFEDCPKLNLVVLGGSSAAQYAKDHGISVVYSSKYAGTYNFALENANPESNIIGSTGNSNGSLSSNNNGSEQKPESSNQNSSNSNNQISYNGDIDHLKDDELGMSFIVSGNAYVMMDSSNMSVHDGDDYTNSGGSSIGNSVTNADKPQLLPDGSLGKYTIYENKVAEKAFYEYQEIGYYVIPDGVTSIGELAYAGSSLTGIAIPASVKKIGFGAFANCFSLEYVTLPDSVTEIEPFAFENTKWKNDWINGGAVSDFYIVGDGILLFYKGNNAVVNIPEQVKQIAAGCFANHKEITQINLPDSLKVIGERAFEGCDHLTAVNGGTSLEEIRDRAFFDCPLDTIRIPASVKSIGFGAFDYTSIERKTAVAAVFMGNILPTVSHCDSAAKLTDQNARHKAFENVPVAILWKGETSIAQSVLSDEENGFSGLICVVEEEADTNVTGSLRLISVGSKVSASDVPESVWVYGNRYVISDPHNYLSALSGEKNNKEAFQTKANASAESFLQDFEAYSEYDLHGFELSAVKDPERENHLKQTVEKLYEGQTISQISTFSLDLKEKNKDVSITKLDGESISVSMNLPNVLAAESLHVVTEDADGQMEEIPFSVSEESNRRIEFDVTHFSPFALFNAGEIPVGGIEEEPAEGEEDMIPSGPVDIGTYHPVKEVNPITLICFLAAVLLVIIATALWFTKRFHKIL